MKRYIYFLICFLLFSSLSHAADRYWVAAANGNWNDTNNWSTTSGGTSGASVPGTSDIAYFDANSTFDCTIDAVVNIAGMSIQLGYTGTIDQGAFSITVGNNDFQIADGTFTGGTGAMDINDAFVISGGVFTAPSDQLTIQGDFTHSAGTFNHNNGSVTFDGTGNRTLTLPSPPQEFYTVAVSMANTKKLTITSGDTLKVLNQLALNDGLLETGDALVVDTCVVNSGWDNGSANLHFVESGASYYIFNDDEWSGNNVYVNKTNDTDTVYVQDEDGDNSVSFGNTNRNLDILEGVLNFESDLTVDLNFGNLIVRSGGTLMGSDNQINYQGNYNNTGGNFVHNSGTFRFDGVGNRTFTMASPAHEFYTVEISMAHTKRLSITTGDTLKVLNRLELNNGLLQTGDVAVVDSCVVNNGWDNGSADLHFVESGDSYYIFNDAEWNGNNVYINKASDTDIVHVQDEDGDNSISFGNSNKDLDILEGILSFQSGLTADLNFGDLIIRSGGTLIGSDHQINYQGSYNNTGGNFIHNSGVFRFDGVGNRTFTMASPAHEFYTVEISMTDSKKLTITSGDSLKVLNKLELNNGLLETGEVVVLDSCVVNNGWDNGSADLHFIESGDSYYIFNSDQWNGNNVYINKTSDTDTVHVQDEDGDNSISFGNANKDLDILEGVLSFQSGLTADLNFGDLIIRSGGTLIGSDHQINYQGSYNNAGGEFVHNSGIFRFDGSGNRTFTMASPAHEFYTVEISMTDSKKLTITSGDSLKVLNKLELNNGLLETGDVVVLDSCVVNSGWDNGSADLHFIESGDSYYIFNSDEWNGNNVYVNKASDTDIVHVQDEDGDNSISFGNANKDLDILEGVLSFQSGLTADLNFGDLIIRSGGTLIGSDNQINYQGSYNNAGGEFVHNSGIFRFDGSGDRTFTTASPAHEFYTVEISMTDSKKLTITSGDSLKVLNKLELNNGLLETGEVVVLDSCVVNNGWDNGSADLHFIESGTSYYIFNSDTWSGNDVYVNKASSSDFVYIMDEDGDNSISVGNANNNLDIVEGNLAFASGIVADINFGNLIIRSGGTLTGSDNQINYQGNYNNVGGDLVHNSGIFRFDGSGDRTFTTASPAHEFYTVEISMTDSKKLTITSGDSLKVLNKLELSNGLLETGEVVVLDSCVVNNGWDNGSADLHFIESGTSYYIFNSDTWSGNDVYVNKASSSDFVYIMDEDGDNSISVGNANNNLDIVEGNLAFASGIVADINFGNLIIRSGGTLTGSDNQINYQGNYNNVGGNLVHNSGTFRFDGDGDRTFTSASPTHEFYTVEISMSDSKKLTITSGDSLKVLNKLELNNGLLETGDIVVVDSCVVNNGWDNGSSDLHFIESGTSYYIFNSDTWSGNDVYINKTSNADLVYIVDEDGNDSISVGNANNDLDILEGNLAFESGIVVDINFGNLIIRSGGTLTGSDNQINYQGNYNNEGGSLVHNSGTFRFDGEGDRTYTSHTTDHFYNFTLEMTNSKRLTISSGDTIYAENTLSLVNGIANTGALMVEGNVDIETGFDGGSSPLIFTGSNAQTLDLNGSPGTFNADVYLQKTTAGFVTLQSAFTLDANGQELFFDKGWLVTTSTNLLTLGDNRTYSGANDSSFVSGPMKKVGNDAFTFPVGKDTVLATIAITAPSNSSHSFQAEYFNESPDATYDIDSREIALDHISVCEYWILDRIDGTSSVNVTLSWDDPRSCGVDDLPNLTVARWDATDTQWKDQGNGGTTGNATTGTVTTNGVVTTFSPFALASSNVNNPLPVELIQFSATVNNDLVELEWITASEQNNSHFMVQRAGQNHEWEDILRVEGKGTTNQQQVYQIVDEEPLLGMAYYRLKQVDFDQTVSYSGVKSVEVSSQVSTAVLLGPNPANGQLVTIKSLDKKIASIALIDASGKNIPIQLVQTNDRKYLLNTANMPKGFYVVYVVFEDQSWNYEKLMVD